ncbi:DUF305 domain-containing protein [Kineococcus glutinatus]|uniref:DUF305 domain-containing protein n=1 Tax=Kineococcus glutinatus TaxID=1070872 RepID=A0ABP9HXZ7_9ACTN
MSATPARRAVLLALPVLALGGGVLLGRALPTAPEETSVDVGFCRDMANHHAQAVAMATTALRHDTGEEVATLAMDVLLTQQNQIGRMQALLIGWDRPVASTGPPMLWMSAAHEGGHGTTGQGSGDGTGDGTGAMPGMASAAELAELDALTGQAFEVRFLQLMIRHHGGAAEMAAHARDHATTPQVRALAGAMVTGQQVESEQMALLLRARGGEPLAAG